MPPPAGVGLPRYGSTPGSLLAAIAALTTSPVGRGGGAGVPGAVIRFFSGDVSGLPRWPPRGLASQAGVGTVMSSVSPKKQPLLHDNESKNNSMNEGEDGGFSWLTALGFTFLTFNSGMAIYRSEGDVGSVAFVAVSYLDLVLLFLCLRLFEKAPRDSPRREWLKVFVWGLTTLLTVMFSHKVAAIMPPLVAVVVWAMAFATIGGGFYAFFVHQDKPAQMEQANRQM